LADRKFLEDLSKRLADEGRLIEAGFVALRLRGIAPNAPAIQLQEMRLAYMAGAQHLFSSIMSILEPGTEPTDADMRRMDLIAKELEEYAAELRLRYGPTAGST
jgi:hypothetical protein